MRLWTKRLARAALALALCPAPAAAWAQEQKQIIIALPAPTLTFSAPFLAEDAGLYKKEGLNVSHRMLVGVEAMNAVISGSAEFTIGTAPVFLRAAAHDQRMLAIANLIDKPLVEMVLRKDVYDGLHLAPSASLVERAKLLKGKTIAIQGVGSIIHAWERVVAVRGGLDPEVDVRIAPMDPPAMLAALTTKSVDGFTTSLPFTTDAVLRGSAVMFASAAEGAIPDYVPFPYGLVVTQPKTCATDRDKCVHVVRALSEATRMIRDEPDKALEILKNRFKQMDPAVLAAAWKVVAASHAKDLRVTDALLATGEKVNIEAKLLDPKEKLASYDGLYTNQYLP
ncbi:MAG TPA: ABC transporter substrate-binding protein [Stellaceae bacterium]|nr:ABC transporter substrate-binding protein [Stellaceae bacterium]